MLNWGAALTGLLMLAEQSGEHIVTGHDYISPEYHRFDYETSCGSTVFRVRFRNGPEENGRVDHLLIDGRPVRDAAETLQIRAARRGIQTISIMHCGKDPLHPVFRGMMVMGEDESRLAGMRHKLFFRLSREGPKGWQISVD